MTSAPVVLTPGRTPRVPLSALDYTPDELASWVTSELHEPAYRGKQLAHWLFRRAAPSYEHMTDVPATLRVHLQEALPLVVPAEIETQRSHDGRTEKALLRLADGALIETVLMRQPARGGLRNTVCLSTQVGCAIGCPFCATGQAGFMRNLTSGEIVAQALHWQRRLLQAGSALDNAVYMGMGEPLANYQATLRSLAVLHHPDGAGMGARHFTISTSGLAPQIERLAAEPWQFNLAISLHAPDDALRTQMVPINRRYPLATLMAAIDHYIAATNRRVTFEYVLLAGVNDAPEQAALLAGLLRGKLCHVNLIPLNPEPSHQFVVPKQVAVNRFASVLEQHHIPWSTRVDRGQDIAAACGQLARQARG